CPARTLPPAWNSNAAIYDPVRDRMVVVGGNTGTNNNDVWALSLAGSPAWTYTTLSRASPPARFAHTAIYDPVRDRMVVFGGYDNVSIFGDVIALSLGEGPAWSSLTPVNGGPRYQHSAIYDPVRDRMLVFGGLDGTHFFN